MRIRFASCIAIGFILAQPASATESVVRLAKTSKWVMNYSPDSCSLLTTFGTGNDKVILRLTRTEPGDRFDLDLYGLPLRSPEQSESIELSLGVNGAPIRHDAIALTVTMNAERLSLVRISNLRFDDADAENLSGEVSPITPAQEDAITALRFRKGYGKRYQLETGSMASPMAAMRKCTNELIASWGFDPAVQAALRQHARPTADAATWLRSEDYPSKSNDNGQGGLIRFRLDVDSTGSPQGCRVLSRTNPDEFADITCALLMRRAKLTPALDSTGTPVKSFYINTVHWLASG